MGNKGGFIYKNRDYYVNNPCFYFSDLLLERELAYAPNCTRLKAVTVNPLETESKN